MVAKNIFDQVILLPADEQVELFERLREHLLNDPKLYPLSDDQKRLLDECLAEHEANPEEGSTWDEVKADVLNQLRDMP